MLNALAFLLNTFFSLFCAVFFIRAWIFWRRIPFRDPYASIIYQLSDFIIIPVRKVIPSSNNVDFPSLLVAYVLCILQAFFSYQLFSLAVGAFSGISLSILFLLIQGMFIFIRNLLSVILWLCFIYALLSWINPRAPLQTFLRALIEPVLEPIRRRLPLSVRQGPIDFSLMIFMLIIIVLQMIV